MAKKVPDDDIEALRAAVRGCGLSLNQLAGECGVGPDRLSRFLRGERDLTLAAAARVWRAVGLELRKKGD